MKGKPIAPINASVDSFRAYLLNSRRIKIILCIIAAIILIQFAVFKYFYPYAGYIHGDSFVYLTIAKQNSDIESYMVGYGRFLRLFSVFSNFDIVLVAFQYLLIQGSALYFLLTLFYFYQPGRPVQLFLLGFMVLNPLFLYMANLVSSDGFFLAFSLIWFTLLLIIIHQPSNLVIVAHTVVLFILFSVRYNAMIYPFIAILAFGLSSMSIKRKVIGAAAGFLLVGMFVLYTGGKYKLLTGTWQYSPFSGWALANNAMYAYRFVDSADRKPVPNRFKVLDNMIRSYFDSTRDVKKYPVEAELASTVYMWSPDLSLYKYRDLLFLKDTAALELKKWASMGPLYADYGAYIIQQYPWYYARYYLWYNALKYYAPPVEFLATYNSGKDSVAPIAQQWFKYPSTKVITRTKDFNVNTLNFYPVLAGVMNVAFLCTFLCFFVLKGFRNSVLFSKGVLITGVIWLLNAGFTIFATSAALRFLAFPVLLMFTFALLLVDWIWRAGVDSEVKDVQSLEEIQQRNFATEGI